MNINENTQIDPKLLQEWQQFNSIIGNLECSKDDETSKEVNTQEATSKQVSGETNDPPKSKEVEIIPKDPSDQVILQIEEIPPLDVFYSLIHKAVVKQQRKRRRTDQPSLFPEQTVMEKCFGKRNLTPLMI